MKNNFEDIQKFKQIFRSPALKQAFNWSKCVHGSIILVCIVNVIGVFLSLGLTLTTKELVDAATNSDKDMLTRYGIIMVALVLTQIAIGFALSMVRIRSAAKLRRHLQGMLIRDILTKEYAKLKGYHSGELVNRVFSDVGVVRAGVLGIIPGIVSTLVSFIGAAAILIALDWRFVLLLAVAGIIGTIIVLLFRNPMKKRHKRMQEAEDKLHAVVQETIENIRLIKASLSEARVIRQVDNRQEILVKEQVRQGKFSAIMNNSMGLMFSFSWIFCMLWGSAAIFRHEMTYGSLAAMIQLIGRVQGPIASAVGIASETYGVIASTERLMELTDLPSETTGEIMKDFDEINIDHVTFRYEDGTDDVLRDISCRIRKGEFVALTGTSGGGKSSLFQLLLGIYSQTKGKVASEQDIQEAINAACIDDLAAEVGLDAELGERGVGISEGQAQRVAVARALLTKAPILLLDESTSALDEETEARMLRNISTMRDKTCLIVTHRRAALSICDYRLHLTNGRMTKKPALLTEQEEPCIITTESQV